MLACFALLGTMGFAAGKAKVIGYYMDNADDYYKAGFQVFKALAEKEGWQVLDITGQGTAPEQVTAVENFITQKVDALVVIEHSQETTSETLKLAKAAGIPEFNLTHLPPNEPGLAGFAGFDWETDGMLAGASAMKHGVKRAVIIEGVLGQGTAGAFTKGFIEAYKNAGKDVGNLLDAVGVKGAGGKDLKVVFWGSGGWFADPAKKAMQDAITSLGPDGFDGAYIENDEMLTGALQAMQEAGMDTSKYWLGSSNGKEKSWKWVATGQTTMDVNQCPTLEADIGFQQVRAYFAGKPYKKAVYVLMVPFEKSNLKMDNMIPWLFDDYMAKRAKNAFNHDLFSSAYKLIPGF